MKKMTKKIILAGFCIALLAGCRTEPDGTKLLDEFVVSTQYDPDANFADYATYSIATDTIGFVSNQDPNDTIRVYSSNFPYPRKVVTAVKDAIGTKLTRVNRKDNPDIGVNIYVVSDLNLYQQVVYPSYSGYYYGYSGYYYYPYVQTSISNTATLVVEFVDLKHRSGSQVKVVWSAYMGDVISAVDYEQQSVDAIQQAFIQSPYLFP